MNHEFTVQIFKIHAFTQNLLGIHVHVYLIFKIYRLKSNWNFKIEGDLGRFPFLTVFVVSEVDRPAYLDVKKCSDEIPPHYHEVPDHSP